MGLGEWFQTFCSTLQVSKEADISRRYHAITRRLNTDFWKTDSDETHSLYVGSYGRNTAIDGVSDVDMVFQLPFSVYEQYNAHLVNGQSALLQAIRSSILTTYSVTNVGADGQVILVPFDDDITFEVVPAFLKGTSKNPFIL